MNKCNHEPRSGFLMDNLVLPGKIERKVPCCVTRFNVLNSKLGKISEDYYKYRWESNFQVIHQTRETVFHRDIQTKTRELKIRRPAEYFLTKFQVFG